MMYLVTCDSILEDWYENGLDDITTNIIGIYNNHKRAEDGAKKYIKYLQNDPNYGDYGETHNIYIGEMKVNKTYGTEYKSERPFDLVLYWSDRKED